MNIQHFILHLWEVKFKFKPSQEDNQFIFNLILAEKMCYCNPKLQGQSFYGLAFNEEGRHKLIEKLPSALDKRILKIAKHIAYQFLGDMATVIFKNGTIYTMDEKNPVAQAVAIKHNKILKVGKFEDVEVFRNQDTKIIDLHKKVMLPGFFDPHIHMCFSLIDHWLDLGPYVNNNMAQAKEKLLKALEHADSNLLLAGLLFDPQVMEGDFDYSREGLDKISDKIGIFILQSNGHVAHVNSAAFKLVGIDKNTEDPPHGRLIRDQNGQLTGQIQQLAVNLFKSKFSIVSAEKYEQNFRHFLENCAKKGCTSLHDCGIGFIDAKADLSLLIQTFNQDPPVRYSGMLVSTKWNTWQQQKLMPNNNDEDLRINGIKCWADGSTQGGSAYMRVNYLRKEWERGNPNYTQETLLNAVRIANDAGWQVGVHANGDAGIDLALDVYQKVAQKNHRPELRHRIEHCTICHKEQLERMQKINVSPSFLIGHIYYYGDIFENILGEQRAKLADPLKTAFDLGLKPTIHSDYNCQPVDPLRCIQNAVTRKIKRGGKVLNSDQCVTPYQAIQAVTINAAWQCHMEDITGSIEGGKLADFVILDEDPLKIDPNKIMHIKILQTWLDGKITFDNWDYKEEHHHHHSSKGKHNNQSKDRDHTHSHDDHHSNPKQKIEGKHKDEEHHHSKECEEKSEKHECY